MILSSTSLSGVTARNDIFSEIDFNCDSNDKSFKPADKLRKVNIYYNMGVAAVLKGQSNWEWNDTNKTTYPIGETTLNADQLTYTFPSDFVKILRIEVSDSTGKWTQLRQFDEQQVDPALSEFYATSGTPMFYRELGDSFELYPKSSVTIAAGLRVYYQTLPMEFDNTMASYEPSISRLFHVLLTAGPSYDYAAKYGLKNKNDLLSQVNNALAGIEQFYATRNRSVRFRIQAKRRNYE